MPYPPITALPAVPSRNAPATFSALMDAFLAAFPQFRTEVNALAAYLDILAVATGPGLFLNGSAAAPGISFDGDTNTGFLRPAADQIGFATGGAQRALLTTTSFATNVILNANSRSIVYGGTGSAVDESGTYTFQVQSDGNATIKMQAGAASTCYIGMGTTSDAFNAGLTLANATGLMNIRTGGGNRISITSAGLVGIGTSSPSVALHVAGSIRHNTHAFSTLPSASAVGAGTRLLIVDSPASPVFGAAAAGGGSLSVPVYSDGTIWRNG